MQVGTSNGQQIGRDGPGGLMKGWAGAAAHKRGWVDGMKKQSHVWKKGHAGAGHSASGKIGGASERSAVEQQGPAGRQAGGGVRGQKKWGS